MRLWDDDRPFNLKELQERYILLLNDPLIQNLNANFKPLAKLGESALDLKVTRAVPYQVAIHYNNYNPPSIGAEQIQVEAWVRNLTRWGDRFDFRYNTSQGADRYAGGVTMPLTPQGTWFDFHFESGQSSVIEQPLANIDIRSDVRNYSWTLSHPVYRDTQQSLT
ncbi:MAG: ShlB/FhaC/HecB family hemolysin secretion/activation protein, partial [Blastocatellia bacterium]